MLEPLIEISDAKQMSDEEISKAANWHGAAPEASATDLAVEKLLKGVGDGDEEGLEKSLEREPGGHVGAVISQLVRENVEPSIHPRDVHVADNGEVTDFQKSMGGEGYQPTGDSRMDQAIPTMTTVQNFHEVDMDVDSEGDEPGDSIARKQDMVARESAEKYVDYWRNPPSSQARKSLSTEGIDELGDFLEKAAPVLQNSEATENAELSPEKARKILHDGTVHGRPITDQQRKYFGAVASGTARKSMEAGQPTGDGMVKTAGLDAMSDFLEKAGAGGGLPTGDHTSLKKKKSSAVEGGSADGGELAGVGMTSSPNPQEMDLSGPGQTGDGQAVVGTGGSQKLSDDDADVNGQMKPHKKPIETTRKSMSNQREWVAHEQAATVSRLRKGEPDLRHVSADYQASELVKSDGFYHGASPIEERPITPLSNLQKCDACEGFFSKSLSACDHCGHGTVAYRPIPGVPMTGQHQVTPNYQPTLRKSAPQADIRIGGAPQPIKVYGQS